MRWRWSQIPASFTLVRAAALVAQSVAQRVGHMVFGIAVDVVNVRAAMRQRGQRPDDVWARPEERQSRLSVATSRESRECPLGFPRQKAQKPNSA